MANQDTPTSPKERPQGDPSQPDVKPDVWAQKQKQQGGSEQNDIERGTGTGRDRETENPGSRGSQKDDQKTNRGDSQEETPSEGGGDDESDVQSDRQK